MTAKVWRRVAAAGAAGAAALTLLAVNAASALAAPMVVVHGRVEELGRNGAFRPPPQNTLGTGGTVGMIAVAAAIIIVVAGVAWILDRQARTRLAAVPHQAAGDKWQTVGDRQEIAGSQSSEQEQERKAA